MKDDLVKQLRLKGLKVTKARITILKLFIQSKKPVDAEYIKASLDKQKIPADMATVYRFLNKFADEGVLQKIDLGEGKYRYELTRMPHHHHVVCMNCGEIQDIEDCDVDELEKKIFKKLDFKVNSHKLEFFGLCSKCRK